MPKTVAYALIIDQFEPFTEDHKAKIDEALSRGLRVTVGVDGGEEGDETFTLTRRNILSKYVKKVLVCGLSGAGKTWLTREIVAILDCTWLNNDEIREGPHSYIGWSEQDRVEHAHKVGQWANILMNDGRHCLIDMIAPTEDCRKALDPDFTVFIDSVSSSVYLDTDLLWEPPTDPDYVVKSQNAKLWAGLIAQKLDTCIEVVPFPHVTEFI